jgi:hypothetical protein
MTDEKPDITANFVDTLLKRMGGKTKPPRAEIADLVVDFEHFAYSEGRQHEREANEDRLGRSLTRVLFCIDGNMTKHADGVPADRTWLVLHHAIEALSKEAANRSGRKASHARIVRDAEHLEHALRFVLECVSSGGSVQVGTSGPTIPIAQVLGTVQNRIRSMVAYSKGVVDGTADTDEHMRAIVDAACGQKKDQP